MKKIVFLLLLVQGITSFAQTSSLNLKADSIFSFRDGRDGKTYLAFEIDGVTWMGENLRHKTKNSWCYDGRKACREFGRLYTWDEAVGACPTGWHLPTKSDWDTLISLAGGDAKAGFPLAYSDSLGFSVKFGYPPNVNGRYSGSDVQASFWTADEQNASTAWVYYLIKQKLPLVYSNYFSKNYGMTCRCVKDSTEIQNSVQMSTEEGK